MTDEGFHHGELRVQHKVGVAEDARRLGGMLEDPELSAGMGRFLARRELAFLTAEDHDGRLWTSTLVGQQGFCRGHGRTMSVSGRVADGDPLSHLRAGQAIGLLVVDFDRRRRLRINGVVSSASPDGLDLEIEQAFGNCPRYIHPLDHAALAATPRRTCKYPDQLGLEEATLIGAASTFIIGTIHPDRGADTSHRGGDPGFVRYEGGRLWWPDYPGNNLFNTLGNLDVYPMASLLFVGSGGATIQLSGTATVDWAFGDIGDPDEQAGRRVWFTPMRTVISRPVGSARQNG